MVIPALRELLKEQTAETARLQRKLKILDETAKTLIDKYVIINQQKAAYNYLAEMRKLL